MQELALETRTLADEIDGFLAYLKYTKGLQMATVFHYSHDLTLLLRYLARVLQCGVLDVTIAMVTPQMIEDFFSYLSEERQNSIRSNKRRLAAVRAFFNYIYSKSEIAEQLNTANPVEDIRSEQVEEKPPEYLSEAQVLRLLRAARADGTEPKRDYAILRLFLHCGASLSEVLAMRLQDVNLTQSYVRLAWGSAHARVVPLSDETRHAIAQYINVRPTSDHEKLFLSRWGLPITKGAIYHMLAKCKSSANLGAEAKVTTQTLRHTCFAHLAKKGFSACEIQALSGLRSTQMPRTYVRLVQPENEWKE
jgi:site-specific recombinase XerD